MAKVHEFTVQVTYGETSVYVTVRSQHFDWRLVEEDMKVLFPAATSIDAIRQ